ncbi:hypothetical protein [uncultured Eudoraea sp.]|uniref:hypothetical protein n=1 Tax=uncultured Eudoraea sp. TaxID=1035614 RepID=UPI00260C132B|nr:hypothetical protein [uncultured Eudoraea sp.]
MKNWKLYGLLMVFVLVFTTSCDNSDDSAEAANELALPLYESMVIDFGDFADNPDSGKSASLVYDNKAPNGNWFFSQIVVGVWNSALFNTLAVPVASFKAAFSQSPENLGENTWQWIYSVDGFTSEYTARLTGTVTGEEVLWEMYITKMGIGAFEEFLWFTGSSSMDGNSGYWLLNQSPEMPEAMLRIDWERTNDEIGNIRYTWVRELDEQENDDVFKDSYLEYGLQDGDLDAYFNAYTYDRNREAFSDVRIEWSRETFVGRVRAFDYFEDEEWHCWDSNGDDIQCE